MKITIQILVFMLYFFPSFGKHGKYKETIVISTELGDIYARLDLKRAPVTSGNFLRYVDAGLFDSACF